MDSLTIATFLIMISAAISYVNQRFVKLPGTIGVVVISVLISLLLLVGGKTDSRLGFATTITTLAHTIDFSKVLLNVMLGFLLFASALHFDYQKLKQQRFPVLLLSTFGVVVSTGVFGGLLFAATQALGIHLPLVYCFLFGALISPTDPIAVASILKTSIMPTRLKTIISGESLFNDGVGLVLFVLLLNISNQPEASLSFSAIAELFMREVVGGVLIGLVTGFVGYRLMQSIKDFQTIFLISIALVLVISVAASKLHASIPLAAVTAGLLVGSKSVNQTSVGTVFLGRIWLLLDEVLNTILFVLIGLQLVIMPFLYNYWLIGFLAIVSILIARMISVSLPALLLLRKVSFNHLTILTWAGLRGGISVAMALTLPASTYREIILASCYFIVIFSIIVQGLTLNKVVERAVKNHAV